MSKAKILFIGDYKEKGINELLGAFVDTYSDGYDILISGYNFGYIDKDVLKKVPHSGMSSSRFVYYRYTAEYVIITTQAPHYIKEKANQKVLYAISDFDLNCFEGCVGDISFMVTDNKSVAANMEKRFEHITVRVTDFEDAQSVVDEMDIERSPLANKEDFLVVVSKENKYAFREENGLHHLFDAIKKDAGNNIIMCSEGNRAECITSNILLNDTYIPMCILKEFDGFIVFDTEEMKLLFKQFIDENEIKLKTDKLLLFRDMQLMALERTVTEHETNIIDENANDYTKYRALMDKLYDINHCADSKVSIIICRYNTPMDLLNRSIKSALDCGHENVEVLVIDDGSKDFIGEIIKDEFKDERLKYYYKENEGLGLSRNYGVKRSIGKYVFYLDSDDTLHKDGMKCLVSHADFFNLNLVVGKRILCDEKGIPRNESLKYLTGDTFTCYYSESERNDSYTDVMVNNLLINREFLTAADIWFTKGLYEDVEYSAILYGKVSEYHFINVPIHDWYQYGDNTTISSTVTMRNLDERIAKEEKAWAVYPENVRKSRIRTIIQNDFNLYLFSFYSFGDKEQQEAFEKIKAFVENRKDYISIQSFPEKIRELTRAILSNNFNYFKYVIDRYYNPEINRDEEYEDFVVLTHYHLYVSCLYALKSQKKCRLYLCSAYVAFDTNLLYRIRKTGLFDIVKVFSYGDIGDELFEELDKRPGEDDIIIPQFLYNRYKDIFKECDPLNDTIYIFSDTIPYWYYIEREFEHIIKLEDAYNSFDREVRTHELYGKWARIQDYEGKTYPLMFYRSDKIEKIIVSVWPEEIPDFYYSKMEKIDTKEIDKEVYDEIKEVMLQIYDVDSELFTSDATLLLTQPLALFGYCTEKEQKRLMKKMCAPYKGSKLLVKPHPADMMNYKYLGGTVLPKSVPIEVYNYLDVEIARVVTFASSAIETINISRDNMLIFKLHDFEFSDVSNAIRDYIKPEPVSTRKRIKRKIKKMIK